MNKGKPVITGIKCPKCGRRIAAIQDLQDVHSLGLALYGGCPACGAPVPAAELCSLARATERIKANDNKR